MKTKISKQMKAKVACFDIQYPMNASIQLEAEAAISLYKSVRIDCVLG